MVDSKILKPINTYSVLPLSNTPISTPHKVLKKQRNTRQRTQLATINQGQSNTTESARLLSTAIFSVSQALTLAQTDKTYLYNSTDTA